MPTEKDIDELEERIRLELRRVGARYILIWPLHIFLVWYASTDGGVWLLAAATALTLWLFVAVCFKNLGLIVQIKKIYGGLLVSINRQVILADISLLLMAYAVVSLWLAWPLATVAIAGSFAIAMLNGLALG
jgi:hypothetical protein